MLKAIVKFCAEAIIVLGAVACILVFVVWLYGLKPEGVRGYMHIGWPGWMWLVCGLLLFGISLASSVRTFRMQRLKTSEREKELEAEVKTLTEKHKGEIDRLSENLRIQIAHKDDFVAKSSAKILELQNQIAEKEKEIESLKPVLIDGVAIIGNASEFLRQRASLKPSPDDPNLSGDILEMLYQQDYSGFGFAGFDILLRVRLTNFGNNPTTVTRYRIRIDIGKNYWDGDKTDIPATWILEREGLPGLLGRSSTVTESIIPLTSSEPLTKGIPQTGWLMFKISQGWLIGFEYPVGGQITLIVTDSFGTDHVVIKPCGSYAKTAKITTATTSKS